MVNQQKKDFVNELKDILKTASAAYLVDYTGLSVKMQQDLKKRLKEADASMTVAKNTLFAIAAKKADYPKEIQNKTILSGQTALILANDDPIAPVQILAKFAQEFDLPQFKVGVVEGQFQDKAALTKLSKLPGKEALYAQVIGGIASPLYGLTGTLTGNLQKLVFILKAASQEKN